MEEDIVKSSEKNSQRVLTFRAELQQQNLHGFIIPHADEHQNEYLPTCAERLAWLTGFTGSAGMAVVLQDEAAIFIDGRYLLQVQQQIDTNMFVAHHITEWPVHEWLGSVLKPGQKLGYDPWLHTPNEIETIRQVCERVGGQLVASQSNPIDAIWEDRPPYPKSMVVIHPHHVAGKKSDEKRRVLAGKLRQDGVDVDILTAPDSIAWLLNIRAHDVPHTPLPLCNALLHSTGELDLFIDLPRLSQDVMDHMGNGVTIQDPTTFESFLHDLGKQKARVLYDSRRTAVRIVDRLGEVGAIVKQGEDPCVVAKACKNESEIIGTRQAHCWDGAAVCKFLAWIAREAPRGHLRELDAEEFLEARRKEHAEWKDSSFPTISAAGSNGAIVHYRATEETNKPLEMGSLYLVDSGGQYMGGTTDITRTVAIGTPTHEHKDRFTRVLKGHIALATARFPRGTTGTQLDSLARRALWEVGLDYDHGTGHGVGSYLGVHEGPQRISKAPNSVPLQPGMILSNEPGFYKNGSYGIRLENLVLVTQSSRDEGQNREFLEFETLTLVPFDSKLIEWSHLTTAEMHWIHTYHARVCEVISPLVDAETQEWLCQVTQPL